MSSNALYIGPDNAQDLIGQSWRWCRTFAASAGVEVFTVRRKPFIEIEKFNQALRDHRGGAGPDETFTIGLIRSLEEDDDDN